jgi:hypothetical protein
MGVGRVVGVADGQVKALGGQRGQPVRQVQLDAHLRVLAQETRPAAARSAGAPAPPARSPAAGPAALGQVAHLRKALGNLFKGARVWSTSRWPASVRRTLRVVRCTSATPASFSSSAMRWLMAALLTPRRAPRGVAALLGQHREPVQWPQSSGWVVFFMS